jgi:hypothetical protein
MIRNRGAAKDAYEHYEALVYMAKTMHDL